ncbi:MAG TPA: peptidylprolyl isomerase [Candidatus Eisenbacteria bacterium]|nr:peptidylprolyl isomerase [Candidatus Eisenbacteria bacterium]
MLKFFRNQKNQKRIYVTLALIIIPSFIITGVVLFAPQGDGVEGTSALGTINGHKVTIGQYLTSYKATMRQAQMIYGEKYTQAKQFLNIKGEAWDRLLLLEYAKKNRIRTSDAEVVDWLQSQSAFQRGGQFDLRLYKMYVDQVMRANTKEFESEVRDMLTLEKVRQGVMKNAVLTDAELRKLFAAETGSREIVYGVLPWKTQKDASVTDAEVDQLYPLVKDRLTAPPRVKIRYLFVPKEEEVSKAAAIADTASIAELSAKYGLEARETALFSTNDAVPEFGPAPELLQKSFELDKGQESAWIRSAKGAYKLASLE